MSGPRVAPGRWRELGPVNWVVWKIGCRVTGTRDLQLFSTLGRTGGLFRGWLHFSGCLMPGGRVPRRETELVIVRVAARRGCAYELGHHRRIGRRAGLTAGEIARAEDLSSLDGWSPERVAMLTVVDQLLRDRDVSDAAWEALAGWWSDRQMIELCLLVAQYDGLATTLHTLRLPLDP